MLVRVFAFMVWLGLAASVAQALPPTSDQFDDIAIGGSQHYVAPPLGAEALARIQILLDRAGYSPGVIDGKDTVRFRLALATHNAANPDDKLLPGLMRVSTTPLFVDYEITAKDARGPFTPNIPALYINQASLPQIGFMNTREMLAERFHMDEDYLAQLNPQADFDQPGTVIRVANKGKYLQTRVARIEADKSALQVRAYDARGRLVAAYPASIGSANTPSPSGTHTVRNKAQNPQYTYDPNGSAQPGLSKGLVRLPPGPNGPVGNAWIGLSKRSYGIHGTPEPSEIGITGSVGCVRLTNWDALELARLVRRGVKVTFIE
ncbi:MAG: L,D-transpeptidase [Pseudomonadota bacterium]